MSSSLNSITAGFAAAVEHALKLRRWKLPQLAGELGVSPLSLRRYISGERMPDLELAARVFRLAEASMDAAFGITPAQGMTEAASHDILNERVAAIERRMQVIESAFGSLREVQKLLETLPTIGEEKEEDKAGKRPA